jgi:large subunit ribosomal protein L23
MKKPKSKEKSKETAKSADWARDIILRPIISEKSYDLIEQGKYTFEVDPRARKIEIGKAIEEIFSVSVAKVNTSRVTGKKRRQGYTAGRSKDWKKAVVTLKEGDNIEFFEGG